MVKITFDTDKSPPRALVKLDIYDQVDSAYDCGEDLDAVVGPEEAKLYSPSLEIPLQELVNLQGQQKRLRNFLGNYWLVQRLVLR